jgi:drug/metabolite transporter (DMT)-like permease
VAIELFFSIASIFGRSEPSAQGCVVVTIKIVFTRYEVQTARRTWERAMTPRSRQRLMFGSMCLIWGSTWVAMKAGIESVPPVLFAGTRFIAAGALLLACARLRGERLGLRRADLGRLGAVTVLMISLAYALIFWGTVHVSSGLAAVIDLSFLPVALLGIAVALGEERFDARRALAVGLGILGLVILFGPRALGEVKGSALEVWGGLAIVASALVYALGSVLARPLLRRYPPCPLSGATLLPGGLLMVAASLLSEPGATSALDGRWGWAAWGGWAFLGLFGSLLAYTCYMVLVRDWGASRAGTYAFVSPVIAVVLGVAVLGEEVRASDVIGIAVMLLASWQALRGEDAGAHAFEPVGSAEPAATCRQ